MSEPNYEMYDKVIEAFKPYMVKELAANHDKGDRDGRFGWLTMTNKQILNELYYHVGKLQEALRHGNVDDAKEYSADIANLALMSFDRVQPLI
jgi:hypothetical protein